MGDNYILETVQYLDVKKKSSFFEIDGYQLSQELILRTQVKTNEHMFLFLLPLLSNFMIEKRHFTTMENTSFFH